MKKLALPLFLGILTFAPLLANAGIAPACGTIANPCQLCHLFQLVTNIITLFLFPAGDINNGFPIVPIIAGGLYLFAGFTLLLSAGNPGKLDTAKTILFSTTIGLVVIYTAWIMIQTILVLAGVYSWTGLGNWWQPACSITP